MQYQLKSCYEWPNVNAVRKYVARFIAAVGEDCWVFNMVEEEGVREFAHCFEELRNTLTATMPSIEQWKELHTMALAEVLRDPTSWNAHAALAFAWQGWRRAEWGNSTKLRFDLVLVGARQ